MSNIFDKWNKAIDGKELAKDVKAVAENGGGGGDFPDIPFGTYEVRIKKMEIKESKASKNPMFAVRFEIIEGEFKKNLIFMNQVITRGFQIHIVNEFLRSLDSEIDIDFNGNYKDYNDMVLDVAEAIDKKFEYALKYDQNDKGYNTFEIVEVFEVE